MPPVRALPERSSVWSYKRVWAGMGREVECYIGHGLPSKGSLSCGDPTIQISHPSFPLIPVLACRAGRAVRQSGGRRPVRPRPLSVRCRSAGSRLSGCVRVGSSAFSATRHCDWSVQAKAQVHIAGARRKPDQQASTYSTTCSWRLTITVPLACAAAAAQFLERRLRQLPAERSARNIALPHSMRQPAGTGSLLCRQKHPQCTRCCALHTHSLVTSPAASHSTKLQLHGPLLPGAAAGSQPPRRCLAKAARQPGKAALN